MSAFFSEKGGTVSEKQFLTDYNKDDAKWDYHKDSAEKISYFYETSSSAHHKNYSSRMITCASILKFSFFDSIDTGESMLKLSNAQFCRVRLCPVCQWRRSMAWRARLFQNLPNLLNEHKNLQFIFLTLTVENCEISDLSAALTHMNDAFRRLRVKSEFKRTIKGFIRSTEVTKSKDGKSHPHFHCILVVNQSYFKSRDYIKSQRWAELWMDCLRVDYLPVVDVRKIKLKNGQIESRAIVETLKYTTKIEHLLDDKDWFLELTDQLFKKRFIATGGLFKDILKEEVSNDDMVKTGLDSEVDFEEDNAKSLYFGWNLSFRKYKKINNPSR